MTTKNDVYVPHIPFDDPDIEEAGLLCESLNMATSLFKGVLNPKNGEPFILHILRVVMASKSAKSKMVAALHELFEDTYWELDASWRLHKSYGFPEDVVQAVVLLTRLPGQDYMDYIAALVTNDLARKVKKEDLRDNLNIERLSPITAKDLDRSRKYGEALAYILAYELKQPDAPNVE